MKKLFLFDLDGTLLNTGGAGSRALGRAFSDLYGIENSLNGIVLDGRTDPWIIREVFRRHGKQEKNDFQQLVEKYLLLLAQEVQSSLNFHVLPGIKQILKGLSEQADALIGLATGNIEQGAWIKLKRASLNPFFRLGGYGSDAEDRTKLIRIAVRRGEEMLKQSLGKEDVYVIGDTPRDIRSGNEAQTTTVAVATGRYSIEELCSYRPDNLFPDLSDHQSFLNKFCHF